MKKISDLIEKREDHLKERFLEQLNNENFRSIVDKLKIDQKELYK